MAKPTVQERMDALDEVERLTTERLSACRINGGEISEKILCQLEILQCIDFLRHTTPHDGRF